MLRIPVGASCVLTSQYLTTIRRSQMEGWAHFFHCPPPGGRRLAARLGRARARDDRRQPSTSASLLGSSFTPRFKPPHSLVRNP